MSRRIGWRLTAAAATAALAVGMVVGAQPYDFGNPSAQQEWMRQLIHRARTDPEAEADRFGLDNDHPDDVPDGAYDVGEGITSAGVSDQRDYWSRYQGLRQPLAWSAPLNAAARNHAEDMYDFGYYGHETVGSSHGYQSGDDAGDRAYAEGYPNHFVFENISAGSSQYSPTAEQWHEMFFVDEPVAGRGHRKNILHSFHREIGIGHVAHAAPSGAGWRQHWVIDFATDAFRAAGHSQDASPDTVFVTGVVFDDADADGAYRPGEEMPGVSVRVFESPGSELMYRAVTAAGGGYTVPLVRAGGGDVPAGATVRVVFFEPTTKRYLTAVRTVTSAAVVFEEDGSTYQQRLNLGLDVRADEMLAATGGDANLDGAVNVQDLSILATNWGLDPAAWEEGNFNDDAVVNVQDLSILATNWGAGGAEVPEPTSAAALLLGAAASLVRRGRRMHRRGLQRRRG